MRLSSTMLSTLLLASGCEEPTEEGRSDVISLYFPPSRPAPPELIEAVESIYGMEIVLRDSGYGAIQVYLYEDGTPEASGWTTEGVWCSRSLWSVPHPFALAHEIGHASGLAHVDAPQENLMYVGDGESLDLDAALADPNRSNLEDWQLEDVRTENWRTERCER